MLFLYITRSIKFPIFSAACSCICRVAWEWVYSRSVWTAYGFGIGLLLLPNIKHRQLLSLVVSVD